MKLTLQQMRYVSKVAEAGSLTEAAKLLSVSQAALSTSISQLEGELGVNLFARKGRGFLPTEEGMKFLALSERVLDDVFEIERKFAKALGADEELNIVSMPFSLAEKPFIEFANGHGNSSIWFNLEQARIARVAKDVGSGAKGLGVVYQVRGYEERRQQLFEANDVEYHELVALPLSVFVSPHHPLASRSKVTYDDLKHYPMFNFEQYFYLRLQGSTDAYAPVVEWRDGAVASKSITALDDIVSDIEEVDGYTVWSCAGARTCDPRKVTAVPLDEKDTISFGYIKKKGLSTTDLEKGFLKTYKQWLTGGLG